MRNQDHHIHSRKQRHMTPSIEVNGVKQPFAKKNGKKSNDSPVSGPTESVKNMSEEAKTEVAAQSNSPVSIADLYAEMENELTVKGTIVNVGVTERIRELVGQIFASTGKDKLLLSAVVKIVEKQEGRKKMYNLVRSIATSKSEHAIYTLLTEDGRTYIVRK